MLYEGVSVDVGFASPGPQFGDLFLICGRPHPRFPPKCEFGFSALAELQFEQVDDFFGVPSLADDGDDVVIWLYPLVDGEPVHHHPGPFTGVRLSYNVLRNPPRYAEHYIKCIQGFSYLGNCIKYHSRNADLGLPPDLAFLKRDIEDLVAEWATRGVVVGSGAALEIDF
jgi:hypothetical protein